MGPSNSTSLAIYYLGVDFQQSELGGLAINSLDELPQSKSHYSVLVSLSHAHLLRRRLLEQHHRIILCFDDPSGIVPKSLMGFPLVHRLNIDSACFQLKPCPSYCVLALILPRLMRDQFRSFCETLHFYQVPFVRFASVSTFLTSHCTAQTAITTISDMEEWIGLLERMPDQSNMPRQIICFSDVDESSIQSISRRFQSRGIQVQFSKNLLQVVNLISRRPWGTKKTKRMSIHQTDRPIKGKDDSSAIASVFDLIIFLNNAESKNDSQNEAAFLKKLSHRFATTIITTVRDMASLLKHVRQSSCCLLVAQAEFRRYFQLCVALERQRLEDHVVLVRKPDKLGSAFLEKIVNVNEFFTHKKPVRSLRQTVILGSVEFTKDLLNIVPELPVKMILDTAEKDKWVEWLHQRAQLIVTTEQIASLLNVSNSRNTIVTIGKAIEWSLKKGVLDSVSCASHPYAMIQKQHFSTKTYYFSKHLHTILYRKKEDNILRVGCNALFFTQQLWAIQQAVSLLMEILRIHPISNKTSFINLQELRRNILMEIDPCADWSPECFEVLWGLTANLESSSRTAPTDIKKVLEFGHKLWQCLAEHRTVRQELNRVWSKLLHQPPAEHTCFLPCLSLILLLGLEQEGCLMRALSMNPLPPNCLLKLEDHNSLTLDSFTRYRTRISRDCYYVYTTGFILCEIISEPISPQNSELKNCVLAELDYSELTHYQVLGSFYRFGKKLILPPFTKFQILHSPIIPNCVLKLSGRLEQRLLLKTAELIQKEHLYRPIDEFYIFLQAEKYDSAAVSLFNIEQEAAKHRSEQQSICSVSNKYTAIKLNCLKLLLLKKQGLISRIQKAVSPLNPHWKLFQDNSNASANSMVKLSAGSNESINWKVFYDASSQLFNIKVEGSSEIYFNQLIKQETQHIYVADTIAQNQPHAQFQLSPFESQELPKEYFSKVKARRQQIPRNKTWQPHLPASHANELSNPTRQKTITISSVMARKRSPSIDKLNDQSVPSPIQRTNTVNQSILSQDLFSSASAQNRRGSSPDWKLAQIHHRTKTEKIRNLLLSRSDSIEMQPNEKEPLVNQEPEVKILQVKQEAIQLQDIAEETLTEIKKYMSCATDVQDPNTPLFGRKQVNPKQSSRVSFLLDLRSSSSDDSSSDSDHEPVRPICKKPSNFKTS